MGEKGMLCAKNRYAMGALLLFVSSARPLNLKVCFGHWHRMHALRIAALALRMWEALLLEAVFVCV